MAAVPDGTPGERGSRADSARLPERSYTRGQRSRIVACGNGDVAIRRDPHREFGIHQIETLGAKRPINSAVPDSFTSALGALATIAWSRSLTMMSRSRTAIRIRPTRSICVPPDLDGVAVPDVLLDRRGQPGRRHVKVDRTGAQPPPQPAKARSEDHHQNRDGDTKALDPAFAGYP